MPKRHKDKSCSTSQRRVCLSLAAEVAKDPTRFGPYWPEGAPPRERIFETACHLFYDYGLHAVSVETIAAVALTNKMTLYRHFRSKDALIAAYLRRFSEEGMALWREIAARYADDPRAQLLEWIVRSETAGADRFNRGCAFIKASNELSDSQHPGRIIIEEYKKKFRAMILDVCKRANFKDPERLTDSLGLIFEGSIICWDRLGGKRAYELSNELAHLLIENNDHMRRLPLPDSAK